MKKTFVLVFGFGMMMLSSTSAFAERTCTPGSNPANGCSWSCDGNRMLVSCQTAERIVPICFGGDVNEARLQQEPCTDNHGSNTAPPASSDTIRNTPAVKFVTGISKSPTPVKEDTSKTKNLKGQKAGDIKK